MTTRNKTKKIKIGGGYIGGGERVLVQSMLSSPSYDIPKNICEAVELERAGCEILRVAIPDYDAVGLIPLIRENVSIPLVADIHFDYKLAVEAAAAGVDKIRINPSNIGGGEKVKSVVKACRNRGIPIRIGVNGGSLSKSALIKYGGVCKEAVCMTARDEIERLQKFDFDDIVLSLKCSSVPLTVESYIEISGMYDYPLHLGVTEAGVGRMGLIKSAAGIGGLLSLGIGDTLRVTLTAPTTEEVRAGFDILAAVGLHERVNIISCPTCGRTRIDLQRIAREVADRLHNFHAPITVAVMGCAVNGPGEAAAADIGIAAGDGEALLFKKGQVVRKISEADIVSELVKEISAEWGAV